jgi:hypothetical protein
LPKLQAPKAKQQNPNSKRESPTKGQEMALGLALEFAALEIG